MLSIHALSAVLFIATALLLLVAEFGRARAFSRYAALMAFATVVAADMLLLGDIPDTGRFWGLGKYAQANNDRPAAKPRVGRDDGRQGPSAEDYADAARNQDGEQYANGGAGTGSGSASDDMIDTLRTWFRPTNVSIQSPKAPGRTLTDCPDCPEMVIIPAGDAGAALAGTADSGSTSASAALPIWPGFAIGRLEVTEAQYRRFLAASGREARSCAGPAPAVEAGEPAATCVSWDDAVAYVAWLTAKTGHHYRLPSALEWHYAAAVGARLDNPPRRMGSAAAELVADCWSESVLHTPAAVRPTTGCDRRTVLDAGVLARDSEIKAAVPMAKGSASAMIGLRLVRELD